MRLKRVFAILMSMMLVIGLIPVTAQAEEVEANAVEYAITHQPSYEEPYVRLNNGTGATYQWYRSEWGFAEITDETPGVGGEVYYNNEVIGTATYDVETGWKPGAEVISENWQYCYIPLEEDEELYIDVIVGEGIDVTDLSVYIEDSSWHLEYNGEFEDGIRYLVCPTSEGLYDVHVSGDNVDADTTIRAYRYGVVHTPIDGQTTDTFTGEEPGKYFCEVTFADGTTECSEILCNHDWNEGYCKECEEEHACATVQLDDNGTCTVCGKKTKAAVLLSGNDRVLYEDVEDAIAAAEAGDVVQLLDDFILLADYTIDKAITLDINGNTIDSPGTPALIVNAPIVLKDSVGTGKIESVDVVFNSISTIETIIFTFRGVYFNAEGYTAEKYLAPGHFFHTYTDGAIVSEKLDVTGATSLNNVAVVIQDVAVLNDEGTVYFDDMTDAMATAEAGDTIFIFGKDVFTNSVTVSAGVALEIVKGAKLTVWDEFVNNGTVKVDGELELPGCDYDDDLNQDIPAYDINDLTNATGSGTIIIENENGTARYTYIEETGKFGCRHEKHDQDGRCVACCVGVNHIFETDTCICGRAAGGAIVCDGKTTYYERFITAVYDADELINANLNAEVTVYMYLDCVFWCEISTVKFDMVLDAEMYIPGDSFFAIGKGAVMTITENGCLNGNVDNISNYGTIIIPADMDVPGVSGKLGSCIVKGDVGYAYTEENGYEICNHTAYADGYCTMCGLECEHTWGTYTSNNDATCEADGTKTASCTKDCGKTNTITDAGTAKGHKYTNYKSNNDATCATDGTKTASCDNGCGKKHTIADTGSKKAHVDTNKDGKCDIGGETLAVEVQKITYKIAFNGNGATSGTMKAMSNCVSDTEYNLTANAFKKTGYTFNGWNTQKDGKGTSYKNKASVKNLTSKDGATVTLYAQWKKTKYTITYKLNGGKNSKSNKASYYYTTKTFKLKNPTRKGYTFKGWYTDKKCTKKITQVKKGTTKNYTLYAKWAKKKYTITYVLNKGKNNKNNKKSYYVTTKTFKLKNPTRKGYTFKGWYSDKKCTKKVTKITKGTAKNIKLYAKWVKKK